MAEFTRFLVKAAAHFASAGTVKRKKAKMRRKTFDTLVSLTGMLLVVVLIVAGALLTWGHFYINNEVSTQLASQKIYFPAANSPAVAAPEFSAMKQYGGQLLTTGAQAEVYADHFIANHLKDVAGGKTYAQLSSEAQSQPNNTTLANQVETLFKGEALRGMLLNAYAFGTIGTIMGFAAIGAYIAAAIMLVLSILGLYHSLKADPMDEILTGTPRSERSYQSVGANA
ncbi:MAG: hypothetical protein M0Z96_02195 [Actinomycetota bacterium]|nr:hypothetical protein [Actinomycetota bacterium]